MLIGCEVGVNFQWLQSMDPLSGMWGAYICVFST